MADTELSNLGAFGMALFRPSRDGNGISTVLSFAPFIHSGESGKPV